MGGGGWGRAVVDLQGLPALTCEVQQLQYEKGSPGDNSSCNRHVGVENSEAGGCVHRPPPRGSEGTWAKR